MPTVLTRAAAVLAAATALTLVTAAAAQAHVQLIPSTTAAGSESVKLTFRVPNEEDSASTTKIAVTLPSDTPLVEVSAQPLAGWKVAITEAKLAKPVVVEGTTLTKAPSLVTWTATDGGIGQGEFQEFSLNGGPIPDDARELGFPVTQTYSDGNVVKWDEPQPAGADEPEHPLPAFTVTPAVPEDGGHGAATPEPSATSAVLAVSHDQPSSSSDDGLARGLGIAGLVAGVLGLLLGGVALSRSGRRTPVS